MGEFLLRFADSSGIEVVDEENPWPGLASFEERYEKFFYGREREKKILLRHVLRSRLTVLTGRSGMGKTSLLRAGLFPRLRLEQIFPVYINLNLRDSSSSSLTQQIFEAIHSQALNQDHPVEAPKSQPRETLWGYLHRRDADFWSRDNLLVTPLLVFDRFEEVLDLHGRQVVPGKEIETFLCELGDLVEGRVPEAIAESLRIMPGTAEAIDLSYHNYKILISLREDSLADLYDWRDEHSISESRNRLRIHPMRGERALEAVVGPGKGLVAPAVAEQIVRWVAGAGVKERPIPQVEDMPLERLIVEPALLSLACRELNNKRLKRKEGGKAWRVITKDLLEIGKTTIIEDFYAKCIAGVLPSVREFVEDRLLLPGGRRDSVALQTVASEDPCFFSDLRKLQDLRLLRIEPRDGVDRVELTHDVLTSAVRASRDARRQREAEGQAEERRLLALADIRAAAILMEEGRAAEGLAFLARATRATRADSLGLMARSAILDLLLRRNWPLPLTLLRPEGRLQTGRFDQRGRFHAVSSAGPSVRLWTEVDSKHLGGGRELPEVLPFLVEATDLSLDGHRLVVAARDGRWQLWDTETLLPLTEIIQSTAALYRVILSPDGTSVLVADEGHLSLWDGGTGRLLSGPWQQAKRISTAEFSPDGCFVVTVAGDFAQVWAVPVGSPVGRPLRHGDVVYSARFSSNGQHVVTASADRTAQVWDVRSSFPVGPRLAHKGVVRWAELSPDGNTLATASWDATVRLWDFSQTKALEEPVPLGEPILHQGPIQCVRFSWDGRFVATASSDGKARLSDARSGRPTHEPLRVGNALSSTVFSLDGARVLTSSADATLRVWDVEPGRAREAVLRPGMKKAEPGEQVPKTSQRAESEPAGSISTANLPAGTQARLSGSCNLIAVAVEREIRLVAIGPDRSLAAFRETFTLEGDPVALALDRDGGQLAAAWNLTPSEGSLPTSGRVRIWDTRTHQILLDLAEGPLSSIDFSADGKQLAIAWWNGRVDLASADGGVVDVAPLRDEAAPRGPEIRVSAIRFGPNRDTVAVAYWDNTARLWSLRTGQSLLRIVHSGPVLSIEFSPDGQLIVTSASDCRIRQTRVDTGETLSEIEHLFSVRSASVGPEAGEARRIVTVAVDGRVRLWEPTSGQMLGAPLEHPVPAVAAQFLLDGQSLVTVSADGSVRLWDMPTGSAEDNNLLASLAEAVCGFRVDDRGVAINLADPVSVLEQLRLQSAAAQKGQPSALSLIRWFLADRSRRAFSPLQPLRPPVRDGH